MPIAANAPVAAHEPGRHVHAVRTRGGIVILDVKWDAYQGFYLPDHRGAAGLGAAIEAACPGLRLGQLACEEPPVSSDASGPIWQDCEPDWTARLRLRDILLFLAMLLFCSVRFHICSFGRLVGQPRRPRPAGSLGDYRAALARFQRMRAFLPFPMQCLFRSHFLLHMLRGYGLPADWVFGVSLFPFQAHCWVAVGPMTLLDRAEKTGDYAPIMVVRAVAATPA